MKMIMPFFLVAAVVMVVATHPVCAAEESPQGGTMSFSVGPSAKNYGLVAVTKDFLLGEHFTLFATAGIGVLLVGGGASWYPNSYFESGPVLSVAGGIWSGLLSASYQQKINERSFLTVGVSGGFIITADVFLPHLSYERRF